jgi:MFS family permease
MLNKGYLLQKVSVAKWLSVNTILWGIGTACHAATFNYHSLLVARIFVGIFESTVPPCMMLIGSQWYTKHEQASRYSFWYCGIGVSQIFGSVSSYGFQQFHNPTFSPWRILYVALGLITCLVGVSMLFILADTPMSAKFLSEAEKVALLNHIVINQTGIENRHFKRQHLKEALLDFQMWVLVVMSTTVRTHSYLSSITNFDL